LDQQAGLTGGRSGYVRDVSDARLPLFPLGHVLMPGCALPLRIFEPRYLRLLTDVEHSGGLGSFGVVALTAGPEVDNGLDDAAPEFAQVGTVAEILEAHPAPNGSVSLLTGGSRRFRIVEMVETTAPYLTAEVDYLDELTGSLPDVLPGATRALAAEYSRLISALTGNEPGPRDPYPSDPCLLSYRLATEAPLTQADHQQLLEDDTATARLLHVQRVLRREVVLVRATRSIAVSPALLQVTLRPN
jgi:Lon protease-like protein